MNCNSMCNCGASRADVKIETEVIECSEHPSSISQKKVSITCNRCSKKSITYVECKGCPNCSKKSLIDTLKPKDMFIDLDLKTSQIETTYLRNPTYLRNDIDMVHYENGFKFEKMVYPIQDNMPKYLRNEVRKSEMGFMDKSKFTPMSF